MFRSFAVFSALVLLGAAAHGQTPPPDPAAFPFEIVRQHMTVDVNADGTFTHTTEQVFRLKTAQGVQGLSSAQVAYSENLQDGDLLEAYTIKPDGKRIDAPLDKIITNSAPMAAGAPMFNDVKIKSLPFPNVEVGDTIGMVARIHQKTPYIPGHFSFSHVFREIVPSRDVRLSVSAPASGLPLQVEVVGIDNKPPVTANGKKQWVWTFSNETAQPPEPGSVSEADFSPRVVMSSIPDYAALGKAYESRARDKAAVTPEIQALADKVTKDISDQREQVRVLYEWVSSNIRYVAISLGVGAIVPHAASEVLSNLYGDCKDQVTLLQALLKAKGIESTAALINAGETFKISKVATLQQFNHVIAYVPQLKLYMDTTSRFAPFGVLPPPDTDKTVLLTSPGKLDQTPWKPLENVFGSALTVKVLEDGGAEGDIKVSVSGPLGVLMRTQIGSVGAMQEQAFLRQAVGNGSGTLDRGNLDKRSDPYEFGLRFKMANFLQMPGPGAFTFNGGPRLPIRIIGLAGVRTQPHKRDFGCGAGRYVEDITIELPASIKVTTLPKPQEMKVDTVTLKMTYASEGENIIKATRIFEVADPHRICSAEHIATLRADLMKMNALLGAQALYDVR